MIAAWGDFNWKTMKKQIERAFKGWDPGKFDLPPQPEVRVKDAYSVHFIDKPDVNQSNIMIGHIGGLMSNPDYPALIIMNQILSFDRMFKRIRTDEGLAYSVWGSYGANFSYPGVFSAGCQTKSASTVKAIRLMFEELKKIQTTEVTEEELQKAKGSYLNGFVFNFDSKSKIVSRMMTYDYFGYPRDFVDRVKAGVEKVTRADVKRVAAKYLKPDLVKILVVGNEKQLDEPLSVLGAVNRIDITIPVAKEEKPEATAETAAKGKTLMEKALVAAGGIEAVKTIKNMQASITLSQAQTAGMAMDAEILVVYPDKMKATLSTAGGKVEVVLNGNEGWIKAPQGTFPMPDAQKQVYRESTFRDPVYYFTHYNSMKPQYMGTRKLGEKEVIDLLLTSGDYSFHLLLDPQTYLVAGQAYTEMGQQGPVKKEEILSEYKKINGLMISTNSVVMAGGKKEAESNVKELKFNIEIKPEWFTK
jgi:Zn-dependent M16 (insulinase) family peptidase